MSMNHPAFPRRHFLQGGASLGVAALAGPMPAWAQAPAAGSPVRGGTLTVLIDPEPPTLTTIAHSAGSSVLISAKTTEGLLTYDFDLSPQPQLATAWTVSADGLQYTFTLRRGVRWHDGKPFTSADVAHSIGLLKQYHPRGRATFSSVAEVRTPDAYTAVLVLSKPVPYLLTALSASESPIVPRHLYESGKADANPANNAPIGTGPFVFKEWVRGSHVTYERNPDYWDNPKPYVDRLIVRFIPDAAARAAAIEKGEVHLSPGTPVPLGDVERLRAKPNLVFEPNGYQYINNVSRVEFNLENPALQDLRVRQAIAHAINRQVVQKTVWYGQGQLIPGPVHPALRKFYVPDLPVLPHDVKRAEALLDAAGFVRGKAGGNLRLKLAVVPISNEGGQRTAEYLKQSLGRIGIEVTIHSQDFATYVRRVYADRAFDLHVSVMSNTFDPTVGIQRLYWSKNFKKGLPFSNGSGYSNPEVDRLLEAAAVEIDEGRRRQAFAEFQRHIVRDLPDITLLAIDNYTIADRRVRGHTVSADGIAGNLAGAWIGA
ncbi:MULTISPECIES: ABC transporter substrate-binding protein [unclassified Variovorax]|jgi:peptide/nickel transport system substrate-binding protein|uniref:ABC transporter substrate-binding protein n=1 Tax=unclassified Variovorax TaxID=663243 RepID=UPI0008693174|nr:MULTISPECIES: ABC transporter substrate-binding protein [unclassified Variovorax]ODU19122.1 MAG: ABC transporter substrate-binding protein [Variovorax sp. SCN 67-85]ODV23444.1 MAG: ABC transporter substrate-binding protein [Variovorax sp. SCN 67-20]OJZ16080.1 MAG: ABC transporter substrate-binding protein [Variovorax sp. 67-131]